jgi:hypothetical protein
MMRQIVPLLMAALCAAPAIAPASIIPQDGYSGRPGDGTCRDCHPTKQLVATDSSEIIGLPDTWQPQTTYPCTLAIHYKGLSEWSFELTTVDSASQQAGYVLVTDPLHSVIDTLNDIIYLKNTIKGAYLNQPDSARWAFDYVSPAAGTGPVSFYWCALVEDRKNAEKYYVLQNSDTIPEARE